MKIALIPPFAHLEQTALTSYQLMLPQLVEQSPTYRYTYLKHCQDPDQLVIMDNGAAEGEQLPDIKLIRMANAFKPNELVVPDVLGDGEATFDRIAEFLRVLIDHSLDPSIKLGIVAAGKTPPESLLTVDRVFTYFTEVEISTIYIPRILVTEKNPGARMEVAKQLPKVTLNHVDIHFLGSSHFWIHEASFIADNFPGVRGIDTSAPFNYTIAEQQIDGGAQVTRPEDYFELACENEELLDYNVKRYKGWVEG